MDRETFFEAAKPTVEVVETPAGPVKVRAISARRRAQYEDLLVDDNGKPIPGQGYLTVPKLIILAAVDDDERTPLFTDDDVDRLLDLPAAVVQPIYRAAQRLAGYDVKLEKVVKNSAADHSD